MNREDVIKLAREAGCKPFRSIEYDNDVQVFATPHVMERFAALVAKQEREECAKVCDDWPVGRDDVYSIAAAIRARGQACA